MEGLQILQYFSQYIAFIDIVYEEDGPFSIVSDHVTFPKSGAGELGSTYGITAILAGASHQKSEVNTKPLQKHITIKASSL